MKQSSFPILFLLIVFFFFSCSKNKIETSVIPGAKPGITGEWQWIETHEGWSGDIIKADMDSIVTLKLNNDSTYSVSLNDQIKYGGHFSSFIIPETDSMIVLQFDSYIQVNKLRFLKSESVSYFQNDTCILHDFEIADGNSHDFKRKP
jgi:hypothetical protein